MTAGPGAVTTDSSRWRRRYASRPSALASAARACATSSTRLPRDASSQVWRATFAATTALSYSRWPMLPAARSPSCRRRSVSAASASIRARSTCSVRGPASARANDARASATRASCSEI
jgi:hypothetical protein